jgi:hypothetical protein
MDNQRNVETKRHFRRDQCLKGIVRLRLSDLLFDQSKAPCNPKNVGIHREYRPAERKA